MLPFVASGIPKLQRESGVLMLFLASICISHIESASSNMIRGSNALPVISKFTQYLITFELPMKTTQCIEVIREFKAAQTLFLHVFP